jgi:FAD:protein FMN transferase
VTPVQPTASAEPDSWRSHHREYVMGTVVTIDVYGDGAGPPHEVYLGLSSAREVLQRADTVFSTWKEHSPVNQLRRGEMGVAQAPPEVAAVLEACETARSLSEGWFDPWAMPGGVDPSGYVKGWAAQRALSALALPGVTGGIVNAAGDIAAFGRPGPGRPFRVAIVDPTDRRRFACVVELMGGIATSGTYERGEHLIDPRTGQESARTASASVTGPDLGLADALATALAVAGPARLPFVEAIEGYEGFVIAYDGLWQSTSNFPFAPAQAATAGQSPAEAG